MKNNQHNDHLAHENDEDENLTKLMMDDECVGGSARARVEEAKGSDRNKDEDYLGGDISKDQIADEQKLFDEAVKQFHQTKIQTQLFNDENEEEEGIDARSLDPEVKRARLNQLASLQEDPIVVSIVSGMLFEHFEAIQSSLSMGQPISSIG